MSFVSQSWLADWITAQFMFVLLVIVVHQLTLLIMALHIHILMVQFTEIESVLSTYIVFAVKFVGRVVTSVTVVLRHLLYDQFDREVVYAVLSVADDPKRAFSQRKSNFRVPST